MKKKTGALVVPHTLEAVPETEGGADDESLLGEERLLEMAIREVALEAPHEDPLSDPIVKNLTVAAEKERCRKRTERSVKCFMLFVVVGAVIGLYLKLFVL